MVEFGLQLRTSLASMYVIIPIMKASKSSLQPFIFPRKNPMMTINMRYLSMLRMQLRSVRIRSSIAKGGL